MEALGITCEVLHLETRRKRRAEGRHCGANVVFVAIIIVVEM